MSRVVNIAGYKFVELSDIEILREEILIQCQENDLKGSILLSKNGINFFLAGSQKSIDSFLSYIEEDPRFHNIPIKYSYTDYQPFRRMLVKKKKEIISLGLEEIEPSKFTGPHISPGEFKQMLDDGSDIVVLDTRNVYETRIGRFTGALDLKIPTFRHFPDAVKNLPDQLKSKTVVMYCTGGIRCEKASVVMLNSGFQDVRQLEGGILAYLEEHGDAHWEGDCFVFDQRVALDPTLSESKIQMCFNCREPLSEEEQLSEKYVLGETCPYCFDGQF